MNTTNTRSRRAAAATPAEAGKEIPESASPARDGEAEPTRWTRPMIGEPGRVQETESGHRRRPEESGYDRSSPS